MLRINIFSNRLIKTLLLLIAAYTLIIISLSAYMYFVQDEQIFFPEPLDVQYVNSFKQENDGVKDLTIKTSDNNTLRGWDVNGTDSQSNKPIIIYFGGNSQEVSNMLETASSFDEWEWLLVNYRGYGQSTGTPSEKNLFDDSVQIYDYVKKTDNMNNRKIFAFGRSLGSGVAAHLASQRQINKLILATPYDSMTNVAQKKYPFLPVSLLLRNKFDSISIASSITSPTLIVAAKNDQTIPIAHAQNLAKALGNKCVFKTIDGVGHDSIMTSPLYMEYIDQFLKQD